MMNRIILTFFSIITVASNAQALQIKQATDNGQITAFVSAQEISRIGLTKDRIRMVNGDPDVDITHDSDSGDVYLKPRDAALDKPINLFISTEKGFTYQLLLMPKKVPSEQILIRNEDAIGGLEEAQVFESKMPFHGAVVDVLKATIGVAGIPAGYKKEFIKEPKTERQDSFIIRSLFTVTGGALQGVGVEVRNTGETTSPLTERVLFKADQVAVYLPQRELKPAQTVTVYLVRRRAGASQ